MRNDSLSLTVEEDSETSYENNFQIKQPTIMNESLMKRLNSSNFTPQ